MDEVVPERVVSLREAMGLSQSLLGSMIGTSQASIQRIEAGETRKPRNLLGLARALRTSPEYLVGQTDDPGPDLQYLVEQVVPYGRPPGPAAGMIEIAGIDLNFGLGAAFMDQEIVDTQVERMEFPAAWVRQITTSPADQLCWTRGVGNSMEPTINDGDVILIDRSKVGSTFGDLYWAIAYGQTGMIKRLRPMPDGSVKILSDNPAVPPETAYDGELNVFGRVVAVVKRI